MTIRAPFRLANLQAEFDEWRAFVEAKGSGNGRVALIVDFRAGEVAGQSFVGKAARPRRHLTLTKGPGGSVD